MREKEYKIFVENHKTLLKREFEAKIILNDNKLVLKNIRLEIKKNNEWLRKK